MELQAWDPRSPDPFYVSTPFCHCCVSTDLFNPEEIQHGIVSALWWAYDAHSEARQLAPEAHLWRRLQPAAVWCPAAGFYVSYICRSGQACWILRLRT